MGHQRPVRSILAEGLLSEVKGTLDRKLEGKRIPAQDRAFDLFTTESLASAGILSDADSGSCLSVLAQRG